MSRLANNLDTIARWFEHRARVYRAEADAASDHPKERGIYLGVAHDNEIRAVTVREAIERLGKQL